MQIFTHVMQLLIYMRATPVPAPRVTAKSSAARTDEEEFYRGVTFRSPQELRGLLHERELKYDHRRPHPALRGKTPAERVCRLSITPSQCGRCSS